MTDYTWSIITLCAALLIAHMTVVSTRTFLHRCGEDPEYLTIGTIAKQLVLNSVLMFLGTLCWLRVLVVQRLW